MENTTQTETSKSPIIDAARTAVLGWYTGKAQKDAAAALDLLAQSEAQGAWVPGASRFVDARLGKSNVATKMGRAHGKALEGVGDYKTPAAQRGWNVMMVLTYPYPKRLGAHVTELDWTAIRTAAPASLRMVVDFAEKLCKDFAPVAALMVRLDATRPLPVITKIGASPTVTATLTNLGLVAKAETAQVCPGHWEERTSVDAKGKTVYRQVWILEWPTGTVHGKSRYAHGSHAGNSQCEACGHAIQNPFNWVPLLLDNEAGRPHSLWVGKDCAKTIFGVKVTGDFEIENA